MHQFHHSHHAEKRHMKSEATRDVFAVMLTSLLALASLLIGPSSMAAAQSQRNVTIAQWYNDGTGGGGVNSGFTQSYANGMFADATSMAQLDNDGTGSEDVACAVAFGQSGPLWGLHGSGSDGDIEGPDELSYIDRAAVFAKVVVNIGWCSVYGPGIGGCTNVNARNSVVVAAWAVQGSARGEFYGHEFGHAVGLSHFNVGVNFMNQTFDPTFNRMLQFQCTGLMNTPIDFDGPGTYSGSQTLFAGDSRRLQQDIHHGSCAPRLYGWRAGGG